MACNYVNGGAIEVCASYGNSARVSALFAAMLSECSMGGNLCGMSTGEALSHWCANVICNNALPDFATAPTWAQNGMPDYVSATAPTDQNADSTGCGMAFLSWLLGNGYRLETIAQAMVSLGDSGTLAQLYAIVTSDAASNAWPTFLSAVQALPGGVTSDNPFGGLTQHARLPQSAPSTDLLITTVQSQESQQELRVSPISRLLATYPIAGAAFVGTVAAVAAVVIVQPIGSLSVLTVGAIGTAVGLLAYAGWNAATDPDGSGEDADDAADDVQRFVGGYRSRSRERSVSRSLPKTSRATVP